MTATSAPFGLEPRFHPSGIVRPTAIFNGIQSGYASNIFKNSPLILATTGFLTIGTAAADICGSFQGVEFNDSAGRRVVRNNWAANTSATEIVAYLWGYEDPWMVYDIQANGSLAQSSLGDQADFVNPGSGDAATGISTAQISTTLAGAGVQAQLRIVNLAPRADNAWGDAFTIVQVMIARHQFVANKVAI